MWNTSSLPLVLGSLCAEAGVPVRIPFMGQVGLFENYLYSMRLCALKILLK